MIDYMQVVNAVNRLAGFREGFDLGSLESQLVQTLEVYKRRGEFDGTMISAFECLELSGYELSFKWERENV